MALTKVDAQFLTNVSTAVSSAHRMSVSGSVIALPSCASGGIQIGSDLTNVAIPNSGTIRVSLLEAKLVHDSGSYSVSHIGMGLSLGATKLFTQFGQPSSLIYAPCLTAGTSDQIVSGGMGSNYHGQDQVVMNWDIETYFNTEKGTTQNIGIWMGDEAAASVSTDQSSLDTVAKTAVFMVEVFDLG